MGPGAIASVASQPQQTGGWPLNPQPQTPNLRGHCMLHTQRRKRQPGHCSRSEGGDLGSFFGQGFGRTHGSFQMTLALQVFVAKVLGCETMRVVKKPKHTLPPNKNLACMSNPGPGGSGFGGQAQAKSSPRRPQQRRSSANPAIGMASGSPEPLNP